MGYKMQRHIEDRFFAKTVTTKSRDYFGKIFHDSCLGRFLYASGIQKTDSCNDANSKMLKINLFMYNVEN